MRLHILEFRNVIWIDVWLVEGEKAETRQMHHRHSIDETSGRKRFISSRISECACTLIYS